MPGMAAPSDSMRPVMRAWKSRAVCSCRAVITAIHWMPFPTPPMIEIRQATSSVPATARPR